MKVNFIYILTLGFALSFSCSSNNFPDATNQEIQDSPIYYKRSVSNQSALNQKNIDQKLTNLKELKNSQLENSQILGSWFGKINNDWFNLTITNINNTMLSGFIVQDTIYKTFKGWYTTSDYIDYKLGLTDDGVTEMNYLDLAISLESMTLNGTSTVVTSKNSDISSKVINLSKRSSKYNMTTGQYPEFSQREIDLFEFKELSKSDLKFICNEMLARHGLIFDNLNSRNLFSTTSWYVPINFKVDHLLSEIEKKNLNKIYSFFN